MQSQRFLKAREEAQPEHRIFVSKNLAVIDQIYQIMYELGWTQKRLALALGKSESEISKWMSGTHNFTFQTISKIEAVLGQDVLVTPKSFSHKFTAAVGVYAKRAAKEACDRFIESPTTVVYDWKTNLKTDGHNLTIQHEKRMIFDRQSTAMDWVKAKSITAKNSTKNEPSAA